MRTAPASTSPIRGRPAPGESSDEEGESAGEGDVDQRRLQLYERSKLRYFYAVAEFGSAAAAAHAYAECDGLEFERSANKLDLRFVPDGQSFEGREPCDVATTVLPAVACCMSTCGSLMFDLFALDHLSVCAAGITGCGLAGNTSQADSGFPSQACQLFSRLDPGSHCSKRLSCRRRRCPRAMRRRRRSRPRRYSTRA